MVEGGCGRNLPPGLSPELCIKCRHNLTDVCVWQIVASVNEQSLDGDEHIDFIDAALRSGFLVSAMPQTAERLDALDFCHVETFPLPWLA